MALDREYFEALLQDAEKGKYKDGEALKAAFEDMREQVGLLQSENEILRNELWQLGAGNNETADTLLDAQELANRMVLSARGQAARIISRARQQAERITSAAEESAEAALEREPSIGQRQQEYAAQYVSRCFEGIKKQLSDGLDMVNEQWQAFLCGLISEEDVKESPQEPPMEEKKSRNDEVTELSQRVNAIAIELAEIMNKTE